MKRPLLVAWVTGTVLAVVALVAFSVLGAWSPPCAARRVLGLACPTCGLTRAFIELAGGRWSNAIRLHPLAPPMALELGIVWVLAGVASVRPGWTLPRRSALPALLLTFAALLVVWIYRLAAGTLPP